jgi:hypothetical protein
MPQGQLARKTAPLLFFGASRTDSGDWIASLALAMTGAGWIALACVPRKGMPSMGKVPSRVSLALAMT